jgi:hypothetical protein
MTELGATVMNGIGLFYIEDMGGGLPIVPNYMNIAFTYKTHLLTNHLHHSDSNETGHLA